MPESHEPCNERGHENSQNAEIQEVPWFWDVLPDILRPNVFAPLPDFACRKTPHMYLMIPDNASRIYAKDRCLFFFSQAWPMTQDMMRISIQVNGVVFIRNSCDGWSRVVMFGSSDVPPKRSTALRTSRQRNMTKEAAWATNFKKGPHISFPSWQHRREWKWIDSGLLKNISYQLSFYAGCVRLQQLDLVTRGRKTSINAVFRFYEVFNKSDCTWKSGTASPFHLYST